MGFHRVNREWNLYVSKFLLSTAENFSKQRIYSGVRNIFIVVEIEDFYVTNIYCLTDSLWWI